MCRLTCPNGVIASYLHASPQAGLGKMGALVALAGTGEGELQEPAASKAQVQRWCSVCIHTQATYVEELAFLGLFSVAQVLGSKIAMHIVAARPLCLDRHSVPEEPLAGESTCSRYPLEGIPLLYEVGRVAD